MSTVENINVKIVADASQAIAQMRAVTAEARKMSAELKGLKVGGGGGMPSGGGGGFGGNNVTGGTGAGSTSVSSIAANAAMSGAGSSLLGTAAATAAGAYTGAKLSGSSVAALPGSTIGSKRLIGGVGQKVLAQRMGYANISSISNVQLYGGGTISPSGAAFSGAVFNDANAQRTVESAVWNNSKDTYTSHLYPVGGQSKIGPSAFSKFGSGLSGIGRGLGSGIGNVAKKLVPMLGLGGVGSLMASNPIAAAAGAGVGGALLIDKWRTDAEDKKAIIDEESQARRDELDDIKAKTTLSEKELAIREEGLRLMKEEKEIRAKFLSESTGLKGIGRGVGGWLPGIDSLGDLSDSLNRQISGAREVSTARIKALGGGPTKGKSSGPAKLRKGGILPTIEENKEYSQDLEDRLIDAYINAGDEREKINRSTNRDIASLQKEYDKATTDAQRSDIKGLIDFRIKAQKKALDELDKYENDKKTYENNLNASIRNRATMDLSNYQRGLENNGLQNSLFPDEALVLLRQQVRNQRRTSMYDFAN